MKRWLKLTNFQHNLFKLLTMKVLCHYNSGFCIIPRVCIREGVQNFSFIMIMFNKKARLALQYVTTLYEQYCFPVRICCICFAYINICSSLLLFYFIIRLTFFFFFFQRMLSKFLARPRFISTFHLTGIQSSYSCILERIEKDT